MKTGQIRDILKCIRYILTASMILAFSASALYGEMPRPVQAETGELILDIIKASGGRQAIEHASGMYASGTTEAFARQDRGTYELAFMRNRKLKIETRYQRSWETRILNGSKGYRASEMQTMTGVKDHRLLAMVYQYKHLDLLYGLLNDQYSVAPGEKMLRNGTEVRVLHLKDSEGPMMDVYVDLRTFHIIKVTGYFEVAPGVSTSLSSEFSDFRNVEGLELPFRIVNLAADQKIAETVIRSYRIDPDLPDTLFQP